MKGEDTGRKIKKKQLEMKIKELNINFLMSKMVELSRGKHL